MTEFSKHSLFLPDTLPCPGLGRCEFHTAIFGESSHRDEVPKQWSCDTCQKTHPTTVNYRSSLGGADATVETACASRLECLPTELLQYIVHQLPECSKAALAFCSRTLYHKVGMRDWIPANGIARTQFLTRIARQTPAYATCSLCQVLRPYHSDLAWPFLKNHREARGVPPSVYAVSEFLAIKVAEQYEDECDYGTCSTLLSCSGSYRKPWEDTDIISAKTAGFSQGEIDLGLAVTYETSARIGGGKFTKGPTRLITHIEYSIPLPRPWVSFTVAQRYAILRRLYLCPHTYSTKVLYRDPDDPTYPLDSSIVHWQPHQGPVPDGQWMCQKCPTDFRSRACSDDGNRHSIIFDVWRESTKSCSDGMSDTTFCQTSHNNHTSRFGWIKETFEAAKPI